MYAFTGAAAYNFPFMLIRNIGLRLILGVLDEFQALRPKVESMISDPTNRGLQAEKEFNGLLELSKARGEEEEARLSSELQQESEFHDRQDKKSENPGKRHIISRIMNRVKLGKKKG